MAFVKSGETVPLQSPHGAAVPRVLRANLFGRVFTISGVGTMRPE